MTSRFPFAPALLLRLEEFAVLGVTVALYFWQHGPWWLLLLLFFAPDLSMLGYLAGSRVGAACYNLVHTYVLPLALVLCGALVGVPLVLWLGLIWCAHLGFDRVQGYGLKYPTAFKDTHFQRV